MEYTLKVTIVPAPQDNRFAARVFIAADVDQAHVGTEQVWEAKLNALDPSPTADPRMWALMLLRELVMRLDADAWESHIGGQAKTMLSLFGHQEHYSN